MTKAYHMRLAGLALLLVIGVGFATFAYAASFNAGGSTFTVTMNKSTYTPGETMTITGNVTVNQQDPNMRVSVTLSARESGSGVSKNVFSAGYGQQSGTLPATVTFPAPAAPGAYHIQFSAVEQRSHPCVYTGMGCQPVPPSYAAASYMLNFTVAALEPNLRISAGPTPNAATRGIATVYSATVNNNGAANAGASVTRFQRATSAAGAGAATIANVSTSAANVSASRTVTASYAHAAAGTFWIRACADINGTISESNESDNCSPWRAVTVSNPPLAGGSCTVSSTAVTVGSAVTRSVSGVSGGSGSYTYAWSGTDSLSGTAASVSKTYATPGAKTGQVVVSSAGVANRTITCTNVAVAGLADLQAGAPAPTTAVAGTAQTFSSTVRNTGSTGAGATQTRYQLSQSASGTSATNVVTIATSAINAGASRVVAGPYTFPTPGTWYLRSCADIAQVVPEVNDTWADNCSAWTAITVSAPALANLTASAITPTTAVAGTATNFSASVTNNGTANAGATQTRFQRATSAAGASATNLGDALTSAANVGVTRTATFAATLTTGTWYLRACADTTNLTPESNEGDNCGAWTRVTVTAPVIPEISCTVSDTAVEVGDSVTYTVTPSGGASAPYTWTGSGGGSYGTGSAANRTFGTAGPYDMQVRASNTSNVSCPRVSVEANWCTTGAQDLSIEATPSRVRAGDSVSLTWSASGVLGQGTSCTVTGPGVNWSNAVSAPPACSASGSATPTINTQSTYTLRCGSAEESVTVNVIPNFEEF